MQTLTPFYKSFREEYPHITTKYATHKIYYYPAAFIPQVVRFILDTYTKPLDTVLDMFAGGGTVGIESFISNRRSILIDINPLLKDIVAIKTFNESIQKQKLEKDINYILEKNPYLFIPRWDNINHWYHDEILEKIAKLWGNFYQKELAYPLIIKFALLYISRYFSYTDNNIPKLYKSKNKIKKIDNLVASQQIENLIKEKFIQRVFTITEAIEELRKITKSRQLPRPITIINDSFNYQLENKSLEIDCILTSPPYLQAQEYIRSTKLDLYWLGYNDTDIRNISKLEIPYRNLPKNYELHSKLLTDIKKKINFDSFDKKYQTIFDSYFFYTLQTLLKYTHYLKKDGKLCIFVGTPTFKGYHINLWEIITDFFLEKGYTLEQLYVDPIIAKKLATKRNNKNPNGINYEYLLILKKTTK
ncbi:MAG: site-specific DNA-methyltransferase [Aquificae bacterium]|nr:site-specific DNA-methyltransferase [Aquificota bacterium]